MPITRVRIIEATSATALEEHLQALISRLEFPEVDPASIRTSLSVIPGQHYAALVQWLDIEEDVLALPPLVQQTLYPS